MSLLLDLFSLAAIAAELGCATTQVDARDADALQRAVAAAGAGGLRGNSPKRL